VRISHDRLGVPRSRSGSLKGTLAADSTRRIDCSTITAGAAGSTSVTLVEAPCVGAHNGEYAGLYVAPVMPPPANDAEKQQLGSHCRPVVAAYGGVPNDGSLTRRFGFVFSWFGLAEWKRGNRGVQCTLWMKTTATKLMKGAGPSAFPVR